MKFKKLLVLSVLWLIGVGAYAANLIERTAPEQPSWVIDVEAIDKTPCEFKAGNVYVLYNVGAEMFFYHGNAWGSQATGSTEAAIPVRFLIPEGKSLDDKQLYLRDYDDRGGQEKWRTAFITTGDGRVNGVYGNGTAAIFIDNNDGPAALMWVEAAGDKVYHLSIAEANTAAQPEGLFWGIDPEGPGVDSGEAGTAIMPKLAEGTNTEWQFFAAPAEMASYFDLYDVYQAAQELAKVIEKAEAKGIDVSAAEAVYNNLSSTVEQIKAAAQALTDAINNSIAGGTAENPADATSMISNPDFDNASSEGWLGSKPNMTGSGSHGPANVAEFWQTGNFDIYQELTGLPQGIYRLTCYGMYRSGGAAESYTNWVEGKNYIVNLYATANGETLKTDIVNPFAVMNTNSLAGATPWGVNGSESSDHGYFIPNDPSCARMYFNKGWYLNSLFFIVGEDGTARIGAKKDGDAITNDWFPFDEFRLTYYGNSEASYQKWVELSVPQFADGVLCTKAVMDEYKALAAAQKATSKDEAYAAIEVLTQAATKVQTNIALWNKWKKMVDDAFEKYATDELYGYLDETGILTDYVDMDENPDGGPGVETLLAELSLTDEELEAEIAMVQKMIDDIEDAAKNTIAPGTDVSKFLTNPRFETGDFTGWYYKEGKLGNKNVECYEQVVDVYQEISNVPEGVYSIAVQAFERPAGNGSYTGEEDPRVFLYMNNFTTPVQNIVKDAMPEDQAVPASFNADNAVIYDGTGNCYLDPSGEAGAWPYDYNVSGVGYVPNSVDGARIAFEAGRYWQECFGLVGSDGKMKIGLTSNAQKIHWVLFANFKLVYRGFSADYVAPALDEAMKQVDSSQPMGKSLFEQAQGLEAKAAEAKASGDGKTMFNMLSEITDIVAAINASVKKFNALQTSVENLENDAFISDSPAKNDALALVDEIKAGIRNHAYEDAEVEGLEEQIAAMYTKMYMPADMASASDENPVECTAVMKSPSFEDADMLNSSTGWTNPGNLGNDDTQKAALAMEFWQDAFDMYQTIVGLPKGTYRLTVDAWCRNGGNADNYKEWVADNKATMAYVYAVDGDSTVYAAPVANVMAGAISDEDPGIDGVASETIEGTTYYLPNSLIGGWSYIQYQSEPVYKNEVICKVGDDGKLTVGMKKAEYRGNSWVVLDNFQLFYLGANSSATPSDDGTAINTLENGVAAVKVEFFNLNGARINKPGKGVALMKQTLSDGSVKLQKVIIK